MSNKSFEPDEEFWQGVSRQAEYYKRIFTDDEVATWQTLMNVLQILINLKRENC